MAFIKNNFGTLGGQGKRGESFQMFSYTTTDTVATVQTAGYFNELKSDVSVDDVIYIRNKSGDGVEEDLFIRITSIPTKGNMVVTQVSMPAGSLFDYIDFNPDLAADPAFQEGRVWWNNMEYTLNLDSGLGPVLQVGQEQWVMIYNDTGAQLDNLTVMRPKALSDVSGALFPTFEKAQANSFETSEGTLVITTMDIPNGEIGVATRFGRLRGVDTSGLTAGLSAFLSATTAGAITNTQPQFPNYNISLGAAFSSDVDGEFFLTQTRDIFDTFNEAWDGAVRETFDFRVTSDGAIITGTLTNPHATNTVLTLLFSTGFYTFDPVANGTIALTAGTDTTPQLNYVYILESTKALTVSTSGYPDAVEHCKIGTIYLQSAATTQTNGALRNQNINDHIKKDDDNGHILHMAERIRVLNAEWESGVSSSLTGTTANIYISSTEGKVWQMHKQTFPAQDMSAGDNIHVVNDPVSPFRATSNLNDITAYSDGSTWNNDWASIVLWGVCNKSGEPSHLMCNLPSDGYNTEANAVEDRNNYTNYTIPKEFKGVGFLIGRFTIRRSGTIFTYNSGVGYFDLRGFVPNNTAGGGTGASGITEFTGLTDTPSAYSGEAGKVVVVNSGETALEFGTAPSSPSTKNFIQGFSMSKQGTAPERVLVNPGVVRDSTNTYDIELTSNFYKRFSANWVAGDDNSGGVVDLGAAPNRTVLTGTYVSSGTAVTGTGSLFTTELNIGDYIYLPVAGDKMRRITAITSDTALTIDISASASGDVTIADPTIYVFALYNPTTSAVDIGFDYETDASNLLALATGFTHYQIIGFAIEDTDGTVIDFEGYSTSGGGFDYLPNVDFQVTGTITTSYVTYTLPTPKSIQVKPLLFSKIWGDGTLPMECVLGKSGNLEKVIACGGANPTGGAGSFSNVLQTADAMLEFKYIGGTVLQTDIVYQGCTWERLAQ